MANSGFGTSHVMVPGPREGVSCRASYLIDEVSYLEDHHMRIYGHPSGGGLRQRRRHPVHTLKVGFTATTATKYHYMSRLPKHNFMVCVCYVRNSNDAVCFYDTTYVARSMRKPALTSEGTKW